MVDSLIDVLQIQRSDWLSYHRSIGDRLVVAKPKQTLNKWRLYVCYKSSITYFQTKFCLTTWFILKQLSLISIQCNLASALNFAITFF